MSNNDEQLDDNAPPPAEASRGPGGNAAAMPAKKADNFGDSIRRLWERLRPERVAGILVVLVAIASVGLTVVGPKILGQGTDIIVDGISGRDGGIDFGDLHRTLLLVMGLYVGASLLAYVQSYVLAGVVQRTMSKLRSDVEDKIHRLPLSYIDGKSRGDLLSRVTNDVDNVAQSMQQSLGQLLTAVLTLVGVIVMMVVISPLLSIVALVTIPTAFVMIRMITTRSKPRFVAQWAHTGALNGQVEEAITGHTLVTAFNQQEEFGAVFDETNQELYGASYRAQFLSGVIQPAMALLSNLDFVAIAVVGGLRVASGNMSLGDVQAFIQYSRQFSQPLTQVASMMNVLQSGVASAERVFTLLDGPDEANTPRVASGDPMPATGRVEFSSVSFSYVPGELIIDDLSYVAEPGTTVAIVGPSGSGKTTLVNLIMRFYELDHGTIRVDDADISQMGRRHLRGKIGMVLQDSWLFGGTIRDNIAYGNADATEEQILEAAKATYVDRFVRALPDGYDTIVDADGGNLSAGEKQLITIARAFVARPEILILDEATSSVDTRTEVLVQHAMDALRSDRTSFVIAHRLSTIRNADEILVLDAGRIVERGSHESLLASRGPYFDLYNAQFARVAAT